MVVTILISLFIWRNLFQFLIQNSPEPLDLERHLYPHIIPDCLLFSFSHLKGTICYSAILRICKEEMFPFQSDRNHLRKTADNLHLVGFLSFLL